MTTNSKSYKFLFVGYRRGWNPLEGTDAPSQDKFWEVRSLPGNVFACGETFDKACLELQRLLELNFSKFGGVAKWYDEARRAMPDDEAAEFQRLFFESSAFEEAKEDGYQFAKVLDQEACTAA